MRNSRTYLRKLQQDTNTILQELRNDRPKELRNQAVNWADLSCVEALYCLDQDGDERLQVCIEEASPFASTFRQTVCDILAKRGHSNVEVVAEW